MTVVSLGALWSAKTVVAAPPRDAAQSTGLYQYVAPKSKAAATNLPRPTAANAPVNPLRKLNKENADGDATQQSRPVKPVQFELVAPQQEKRESVSDPEATGPTIRPLKLDLRQSAPGLIKQHQVAAQVDPPANEIPPPRPMEGIDTPRAPEGDDTQRQILIQSARNSVALGDLPQAVERFEALLEVFPNDVEGRLEYAGILARLGRTDQAVTNYRRVGQLDPGNIEAISALADLLVGKDQLEEASELLQQQLKQNPSDISTALRLSSIYLQTGNRVLAMETFNEYVRSANLGNANRVSAATILYDLNDPAGAIQLLIPLMETDVLGHDGLKLALRCYATVGGFESMRNMVNHYVQLDPQNVPTILELGEELLDEERFQAALCLLEEAARFIEPEAQILTLLIRARVGEFQLPVALQAMEEFCGVIPEWERTLLMGEIMYRSGNYLEALSDFEQTLMIDSENARAVYGKARALQELGQYDFAESVLASYLMAYPDKLGTKFRLAQLHVDRREFGRAESLYREILNKNPGVVFWLRSVSPHVDQAASIQRSRRADRSTACDPAFREFADVAAPN
ncbi:tetratricopeptide repeat protein [Blastopirellula marina]|uniref:tetratricopeptide repeat protein n=1 Tax=Blastopirellula marina TaxID=124 RepID=UPI00058EA943|nr:tetratricopeptide repeat protein [Blastopirellula marina]